MADPKRIQLGFGDLNQIEKPHITKAFDPADTTVMGSMASAITDQFKYDIFKNVGQLKGVVLRKDEPKAEGFWGNLIAGFLDEPLLGLKVRVPEIHAALPEPDMYGPDDGPHQSIIDLYPTFYAMDSDTSKAGADIAPGDIVIVDWLDKENLTQPVWIKKFSKGPGGLGGKSARGNGIFYPNQSSEAKTAFNSSRGLYGTGKSGCGNPGGRSGGGLPAE